MWVWGLVVLGGLVLGVSVVALIGSRLPLYHVASREAPFRQRPEAVWAVMTDFAAGPTWRPGLKRVERGADIDGHPVWIEVGKTGRMPLEVVEMDRPRRLRLRIADDKLPFGGTWTFDIVESPDGCRLRITEEGDIHNPIFRFMARFVFGYHGAMEAYLKALGKKLGEEAT